MRELLEVDVRDRVFGMTGQAFLSLIPLAIIVSTWLSESNGRSLAGVVNQRLGLTESTAETVLVLFTTPEPSPATATATGVSLALLFVSLNSFTRTLRRSMERPWGLPRVGWHGQVTGLAGVGLLILMQASLSAIAIIWHSDTPGPILLESLVRTVVAGAFWLGIGHLLSHRRIPVRHLWPGALVGGVGQSGIALWTIAVLTVVFERDAARYGVIGVARAIVTWILAVCGLAVAVAVGVVGAQVERAARWIEATPDPLTQPLLSNSRTRSTRLPRLRPEPVAHLAGL